MELKAEKGLEIFLGSAESTLQDVLKERRWIGLGVPADFKVVLGNTSTRAVMEAKPVVYLDVPMALENEFLSRLIGKTDLSYYDKECFRDAIQYLLRHLIDHVDFFGAKLYQKMMEASGDIAQKLQGQVLPIMEMRALFIDHVEAWEWKTEANINSIASYVLRDLYAGCVKKCRIEKGDCDENGHALSLDANRAFVAITRAYDENISRLIDANSAETFEEYLKICNGKFKYKKKRKKN